MIYFPNCKINIGLNIVSKRSDGYHDLETIFYPINKLHDAIEILPQAGSDDTTTSISNVQFQSTGLPVAGKEENNLCIKAYQLLKADFPDLPPIQLCLHKAIPMGAGLGGGSANGAFTLLLLNRKFNLHLLESQLIEYALQLGSDCPFFIINKPCFATGRGEIMEPVELNLKGYSIVLINPGIHVSTAEAFAGISPAFPTESLEDLIKQPMNHWKNNIVNDFEKTVFTRFPQLDDIKQALYQSGALYAAMSGTGSTVYGIFEKNGLPKQKLFPDYYELHADL